ncbi:MAG: glycosyltransferase family 39 protein [Dehalococcoidia bacterium]|nr:glycosyltransferase family 39 protein [Dehalococcoidia bacterium]
MVANITTVGLAVLVMLAAIGVGLQVLPRLGFKFDSRSEALAFSSGVGFLAQIWVMIPLAFLGWLYPVVAWGVMALFLAFGGPPLWQFLRQNTPGAAGWLAEIRWPLRILLVVGLFYALGYLIVSLAPSLDGDSLYGYLLLPREYARHHSLVVVDYAYGYYYPQNGQMLTTFGFLLQGEALGVTLVSFAMGILSALVVYSVGRTYFGKAAGLIGAVVFYGMFAVGWINGGAKVDLAWAFFDLLGIFAFSRWFFGKERQRRWLALAGLFVGAGLAVKYSSFYTIVALGMALLVGSAWRQRTTVKEVLTNILAFGLPISLGALWLVRTYLLTGNPVYPMFNSLILGNSAGEIGANQYDNYLLFPRILWDMSMSWIAGGMGKPVGPILLGTIPLLLLFRAVNWRVKWILFFALITGSIWFLGVQRPRHIFSTLALLSAVSGYAIVLLLQYRRPLGLILVVLVIAALGMNWVTWARNSLPVPESIAYAAGIETREQFLDAKLGEYFWYPDNDIRYYIRDKLPLDARLVGVPSSGAAYYIDRPIYGRLLRTGVSTQATVCDLKAHDISHMWVNFDIIDHINALNPTEKQPAYWPQDAEFRLAYLPELYSNGRQSIYQVRYPDALDCSNIQLRPWYP